jgi:hypothetical protein
MLSTAGGRNWEAASKVSHIVGHQRAISFNPGILKGITAIDGTGRASHQLLHVSQPTLLGSCPIHKTINCSANDLSNLLPASGMHHQEWWGHIQTMHDQCPNSVQRTHSMWGKVQTMHNGNVFSHIDVCQHCIVVV